jgi:hypothetical protein
LQRDAAEFAVAQGDADGAAAPPATLSRGAGDRVDQRGKVGGRAAACAARVAAGVTVAEGAMVAAGRIVACSVCRSAFEPGLPFCVSLSAATGDGRRPGCLRLVIHRHPGGLTRC